MKLTEKHYLLRQKILLNLKSKGLSNYFIPPFFFLTFPQDSGFWWPNLWKIYKKFDNIDKCDNIYEIIED